MCLLSIVDASFVNVSLSKKSQDLINKQTYVLKAGLKCGILHFSHFCLLYGSVPFEINRNHTFTFKQHFCSKLIVDFTFLNNSRVECSNAEVRAYLRFAGAAVRLYILSGVSVSVKLLLTAG